VRLDDLGYPVFIDYGLGGELRRFLRDRYARAIVLCDRNVEGPAQRIARYAGSPEPLGIELGEERKTLGTVATILERLAGCGARRDTAIIGVGGGVAADVFGFAAASFMRGVPYVHVATSLVAMVDAAIGGKTGVNLRAGKNLAGAFVDPAAVFCDLDALATLPYRHLRDGLAETVKHGVIEGGDFFDSLETLAPHPFSKWPWEHVVAECVRVKMMFVNDDPNERGVRETLNLGHTFGHAIERASHYRVSHGAGVSVGLRAAGLLALREAGFSGSEHMRILALLTLLRMPLRTQLPARAILAAMNVDKKKRRDGLRFVLPRAIGDVECGVRVSEPALRRTLEQIRRAPDEREFV